MAWLYLLLAGLLEVVWAYAMKLSQGFTPPVPTAIMIAAMCGSVGLLTLAMRTLPLGTSYMVWTGIGALGAFLLGIWAAMSDADLDDFEKLLDGVADRDLLAWFVGEKPIDPAYDCKVWRDLVAFHRHDGPIHV